ncbi:MAG: hypothetical protein AAF363_07805 [Bacteroidota bacterium]
MKQKYKISLYLIAALLFLLFLTNPPETQFLYQVSRDYGQIHTGTNITTDALLQIGESKRTSYGVFSLYTYHFGNIGVSYFGIANRVFFIRSNQIETLSPNKKEQKA